ncbi:hypothetical protein JTB14_007202 [Gonioctena quinquepunctata]|nr:hypothetical protein JTB14_007202 [Gonioctena quinquepunctata]
MYASELNDSFHTIECTCACICTCLGSTPQRTTSKSLKTPLFTVTEGRRELFSQMQHNLTLPSQPPIHEQHHKLTNRYNTRNSTDMTHVAQQLFAITISEREFRHSLRVIRKEGFPGMNTNYSDTFNCHTRFTSCPPAGAI